jgi:hypothetical protein
VIASSLGGATGRVGGSGICTLGGFEHEPAAIIRIKLQIRSLFGAIEHLLPMVWLLIWHSPAGISSLGCILTKGSRCRHGGFLIISIQIHNKIDKKGGSMILTLEDREAEVLKRLLEHCLVELRDEIHHTDRAAFKEGLKAEEALLRNLVARLRSVAGLER